MEGMYLAVFGRPNGRVFSDVGDTYFELYDGKPTDVVTWFGESWTRVSDLRNGVAHYLPSSSLA